MKNSKIIPIFFATDDNYVPFLSVALCSLIDNASKQFNYNIHILNTGLTSDNEKALSKYSKGNFQVFFNNVKSKVLSIKETLPTRDYYTEAIFFRLFIQNMFPEYSKALYLDCDIALNGDISKLYNIDIADNYIGAIPDEAVSITPEFIEYVEKFLGVSAGNYFNSGILIMNLDVLRKEKFEDKFLNLLRQYKFIVAPDQDYLNVLCKNRVFYISKIWNKMPILSENFKLNELMLVHYNLSFKPWHYDNISYDELFWKYAQKTDFYKKIIELKNNFTDEHKQKDKLAGENLIKLTEKLANDKNAFNNLVKSGKIKL